MRLPLKYLITYSSEGGGSCSSHDSGFSPGALPQIKNLSCSRPVTCLGWNCCTLDGWIDGWMVHHICCISAPQCALPEPKITLKCVQRTWWLWLAQGTDLPSSFPRSLSNWASPGCNGTGDGAKQLLPSNRNQRKQCRYSVFQWSLFIAPRSLYVSESPFVLWQTAAFKVK